MTTTQVFIELLITGFGSLVWIVLLFLGLNGFNFEILMNFEFYNVFLLPLAGFAYILGIIIDRIGFRIFKFRERSKIKKVFTENENREDIQYMEVFIFNNSDHLKSKIDYNRSRLRLTRSWIINFFMMSLSLTIMMIFQNLNNLSVVIFFIAFSLIFCLLSYYTWNKLSGDYYKNIKSSYSNLKKLVE